MIITHQFPNTLIVAVLRNRAQATGVPIGDGCRMAPREVRFRLVHVENLSLVTSRHDKRAVPPSRFHAITREGVWRVEE